MMFNATFKNISVMSWQSVLLVEETWSIRKNPQTCCKSLTLVMIGTDYTASCKSNYDTITTTMAPYIVSNLLDMNKVNFLIK